MKISNENASAGEPRRPTAKSNAWPLFCVAVMVILPMPLGIFLDWLGNVKEFTWMMFTGPVCFLIGLVMLVVGHFWRR